MHRLLVSYCDGYISLIQYESSLSGHVHCRVNTIIWAVAGGDDAVERSSTGQSRLECPELAPEFFRASRFPRRCLYFGEV